MANARLAGFFLLEYFEKASTALLKKLAQIDPKTATAAQIRELYAELTKISEDTTSAKLDWEKEQKEADEIVALFDKRVRTAELLETQLQAAPEDQKAAFTKSRDAQVALIEKMLPDVEREKGEAESARKLYDDMLSFTTDFAEQLKNTEAAMRQAERDMQSAAMERKRAELREGTAKAAAGLQASGQKANAVLSAMHEVAEEQKKKAAAANLRADLLKKTNVEEEDPLIRAAMAQVEGKAETINMSFAERMAAIKGTVAA